MHVKLDSTLERLGDKERLRPLADLVGSYEQNEHVVLAAIEGSVGHDNYLSYLAEAWNNHLGYVLTPDYLWNMVLSELTIVVRDNAETYRDLFTTSDEKIEITVEGVKPQHLLTAVSSALKHHVPVNTGAFLPDFTTTSEAAMFAHRAAFLDCVSPYYNYSMLLCGYPSVEFRGTPEDWLLFQKKISQLKGIFSEKSAELVSYLDGVDAVVAKLHGYAVDLSQGLEIDTTFLKGIMTLERCGSGHQVEVKGWISQMYIKQPRPAYVSNFSRHVAVVDYKDLNVNKNYRIYSGLLSSEVNGDILWPMFGFIQTERAES